MLRTYLPKSVNNQLFGFRDKYGQRAWENDPDWEKWTKLYPSVYKLTQRTSSIQSKVNDAGYEILRTIDFNSQNVGEIGPGGGYHFKYLNAAPKAYHAFDVCVDFFEEPKDNMPVGDTDIQCHKTEAYIAKLPVEDNSLDLMLSFFSMEHLYPLEEWLTEIFRVLRPGGQLVGAIPAEGGIAWGIGRWLTSRRSLMREYNIDVRKIVCWEHPNTCDEIVKNFKSHGEARIHKWPLPFMPFDCNLLVKFLISKNSR